MDDHNAQEDEESKLTIVTSAFEVLSIPQKEKSDSDEEFSNILPDVVPDWAVEEHSNHQLDCARPTTNYVEQTSPYAERVAPPGRLIRRASRRSSILRLPGTSNENSIENPRAGPSKTEINDKRSPSTEGTSQNASLNSGDDIEGPLEQVHSKDLVAPKEQRGSSSDRSQIRSLKSNKPDSAKCLLKQARHLPVAEQIQRYFNEVPSRFHSFPAKRPTGDPSVAAKRKSVFVQSVHQPMAGRSSTKRGEKEPKNSDRSSKAFPPPNLAKVSTKFSSSSQSSVPAAMHKFNARPVPRSSVPHLPQAPVHASVVLVESKGKTQKKLVNTHVGVPQSGCSGIRKLDVKPFSFVERDKQARKLREEKRKQALEESVKFPMFTANPLPPYMVEKTNKPSSLDHHNKAESSNKKTEKENVPSR